MKMFEDATQALQGHAEDSEFSSIGECIPIIKQLQSRLITLQREFPEAKTWTGPTLSEATPIPSLNPATAFITNYINNAFEKLAKYYGLTDALVWYTVGMVMNPAVKWRYLKW
jgi:hypothetical protein